MIYFFYTFLKGLGFEGFEYNDNPDNRDPNNEPEPVPFWLVSVILIKYFYIEVIDIL